MSTILFVIAAYLIGSVSFAVVVSLIFGLADPRTYGSRNPGATNVLRSGNKAAAVLTLLGDGAKGWLAVFLANRYGLDYGVSDAGIALCAIAVFLGHLWPVFFRFAGGKGVATALGVLLAIEPWLGVATLATWLIVAVFFRYSSLAAIVSAVFAPFFYVLCDRVAWYASNEMTLAIVVMGALLIYRHRKNIVNLMKGKEGKLGAKKTG
jgi:glycerol-3-phosphate acyltransferase PlsY